MLTISVKNFGPIAEGSVDLKPLTIFVGPSNTGKSYMATAVYAVMQAVRVRYPAWGTFQFGRLPDTEVEIPFDEFPDEIRKAIWQGVHTAMENARSVVIEQLNLCYGGRNQFTRRNAGPSDFLLQVERLESPFRMVISLQTSTAPPVRLDISDMRFSRMILDHIIEDANSSRKEFFISTSLVTRALELTFAGFPAGTYYLPAARSGIIQAQKVLASALVRQASFAGIRELNVPTMPGVTTEFLSNLINLDRRMGKEQCDSLREAIAFIETEVLHGKIDLDKSAGLPFPDIAYETTAGKFTLDQTSSMVSELAPLILFLKYLVRPGDLLILEEPESHLHPAAQLQLARGIARLVNAGVQVLITTHSSDFKGQIDNLLSMSNVSRETAELQGLEPEDCLRPEQVSAYGFRIDSDKGGSVAYPLPVGSDVGIEDEEFLPIAEVLYEQAIQFQRNRLK